MAAAIATAVGMLTFMAGQALRPNDAMAVGLALGNLATLTHWAINNAQGSQNPVDAEYITFPTNATPFTVETTVLPCTLPENTTNLSVMVTRIFSPTSSPADSVQATTGPFFTTLDSSISEAAYALLPQIQYLWHSYLVNSFIFWIMFGMLEISVTHAIVKRGANINPRSKVPNCLYIGSMLLWIAFISVYWNFDDDAQRGFDATMFVVKLKLSLFLEYTHDILASWAGSISMLVIEHWSTAKAFLLHQVHQVSSMAPWNNHDILLLMRNLFSGVVVSLMVFFLAVKGDNCLSRTCHEIANHKYQVTYEDDVPGQNYRGLAVGVMMMATHPFLRLHIFAPEVLRIPFGRQILEQLWWCKHIAPRMNGPAKVALAICVTTPPTVAVYYASVAAVEVFELYAVPLLAAAVDIGFSIYHSTATLRQQGYVQIGYAFGAAISHLAQRKEFRIFMIEFEMVCWIVTQLFRFLTILPFVVAEAIITGFMLYLVVILSIEPVRISFQLLQDRLRNRARQYWNTFRYNALRFLGIHIERQGYQDPAVPHPQRPQTNIPAPEMPQARQEVPPQMPTQPDIPAPDEGHHESGPSSPRWEKQPTSLLENLNEEWGINTSSAQKARFARERARDSPADDSWKDYQKRQAAEKASREEHQLASELFRDIPKEAHHSPSFNTHDSSKISTRNHGYPLRPRYDSISSSSSQSPPPTPSPNPQLPRGVPTPIPQILITPAQETTITQDDGEARQILESSREVTAAPTEASAVGDSAPSSNKKLRLSAEDSTQQEHQEAAIEPQESVYGFEEVSPVTIPRDWFPGLELFMRKLADVWYDEETQYQKGLKEYEQICRSLPEHLEGLKDKKLNDALKAIYARHLKLLHGLEASSTGQLKWLVTAGVLGIGENQEVKKRIEEKVKKIRALEKEIEGKQANSIIIEQDIINSHYSARGADFFAEYESDIMDFAAFDRARFLASLPKPEVKAPSTPPEKTVLPPGPGPAPACGSGDNNQNVPQTPQTNGASSHLPGDNSPTNTHLPMAVDGDNGDQDSPMGEPASHDDDNDYRMGDAVEDVQPDNQMVVAGPVVDPQYNAYAQPQQWPQGAPSDVPEQVQRFQIGNHVWEVPAHVQHSWSQTMPLDVPAQAQYDESGNQSWSQGVPQNVPAQVQQDFNLYASNQSQALNGQQPQSYALTVPVVQPAEGPLVDRHFFEGKVQAAAGARTVEEQQKLAEARWQTEEATRRAAAQLNPGGSNMGWSGNQIAQNNEAAANQLANLLMGGNQTVQGQDNVATAAQQYQGGFIMTWPEQQPSQNHGVTSGLMIPEIQLGPGAIQPQTHTAPFNPQSEPSVQPTHAQQQSQLVEAGQPRPTAYQVWRGSSEMYSRSFHNGHSVISKSSGSVDHSATFALAESMKHMSGLTFEVLSASKLAGIAKSKKFGLVCDFATDGSRGQSKAISAHELGSRWLEYCFQEHAITARVAILGNRTEDPIWCVGEQDDARCQFTFWIANKSNNPSFTLSKNWVGMKPRFVPGKLPAEFFKVADKRKDAEEAGKKLAQDQAAASASQAERARRDAQGKRGGSSFASSDTKNKRSYWENKSDEQSSGMHWSTRGNENRKIKAIKPRTNGVNHQQDNNQQQLVVQSTFPSEDLVDYGFSSDEEPVKALPAPKEEEEEEEEEQEEEVTHLEKKGGPHDKDFHRSRPQIKGPNFVMRGLKGGWNTTRPKTDIVCVWDTEEECEWIEGRDWCNNTAHQAPGVDKCEVGYHNKCAKFFRNPFSDSGQKEYHSAKKDQRECLIEDLPKGMPYKRVDPELYKRGEEDLDFVTKLNATAWYDPKDPASIKNGKKQDDEWAEAWITSATETNDDGLEAPPAHEDELVLFQEAYGFFRYDHPSQLKKIKQKLVDNETKRYAGSGTYTNSAGCTFKVFNVKATDFFFLWTGGKVKFDNQGLPMEPEDDGDLKLGQPLKWKDEGVASIVC